MALARHKTLTIVANRREIYAAIRAAYREAGLKFRSLQKGSLLQDPMTEEEWVDRQLARMTGFARKLPVLGGIVHWPPKVQGPRPLPGWKWRERAAAIEWFSTFMSADKAELLYDTNEWGPC